MGTLSGFRRSLRVFSLAMVLLVCAGRAQAAVVTVAWDPNTESDLAGYVVSWGTVTGAYAFTQDVGNVAAYACRTCSPARPITWPSRPTTPTA
jgi:hypothetical protein